MSKPSQEEIYNTLVKARGIQATRGWTQRTVIDEGGHVCMRGAILTAIEGSTRGTKKVQLVSACEWAMGFSVRSLTAWSPVLPPVPPVLTVWNDHPERTFEEVLERFDQGIEAAKPEPEPPKPEPVFVPEKWTKAEQPFSLVCG